MAKRVNPLKVVKESDLIAFRHAAIVLGILEQARKSLADANSLTYEIPVGEGGATRIIERPEVGLIAKYEKILDAKLARLGLLPEGQEKAAAAPAEPEEVDPLDMFVTGGTGAATEDSDVN